ncbi:hypothetical protein AVEN_19882-1 [Araneus ventricosus]|uniref:Uncharacterized protein n=1 Tax=Araneus ventricosus TaxID=182803 RepID=A0A4Y2TTZ1_ARAVE|nr:hypothetical protein AVEN_19882-1 [Araneus ventricosus]
MRDDFEGVNFLARKRTWKYKGESEVKKRRKKEGRKKEGRDGRGLSFSNEDPVFNDWNGLPVTHRHKKKKNRLSLQDGQLDYGNNGALHAYLSSSEAVKEKVDRS